MASINLLPATLDISCVLGDDVQLVVTILSSAGCEGSVADITNMNFDASFVVNNVSYASVVTKNTATGKVTLVWSDTQTSGAGAGSYPWKFRVTDGDVTRTRLSGIFKIV